MRTNLNVPYKDSQKVKALGARWDGSRKTWYVQDVENLVDFLPWIDDNLKRPVDSNTKK